MNNLVDILITLPAFLVGISILVGVHEFGHFWVARRLGIKTLRFSIGFGRVLWSRFGKDGTEYAFSAIPLGGYVRMVDERDADVVPADLPFAFNRQPVWKRVAVLFAGPGFNFLFAILAYWVLLNLGEITLRPVIGTVAPNSIAANAGLRQEDVIESVGGKEVATFDAASIEIVKEVVGDGIVELRVRGRDGNARDVNLLAVDRSVELTEPGALYPGLGFDFQVPALVGKLSPGSAGEQAGLKVGDRITGIDGKAVSGFGELRTLIGERPDRDVTLDVQRGGESLALTAHIASDEEEGRVVGRLGVGVSEDFYAVRRYTGIDALTGAVAKTWDTSVLSVNLMWKLITGKLSLKGISGPVGIAKFAGDAAQQGAVVYLSFLALISISIGILNLMPIPILDGGQIVYQLAELLKGGPVSERAQILGQQAGIVLLVLLMGLALFNDLAPHIS